MYFFFGARSITESQDSNREDEEFVAPDRDKSFLSKSGFREVQTQRHVTPSLSEPGGRANLFDRSDHVLMLTRVPGAGGEVLVLILQRLQGHNAFKHIRLPPGDEGLLSTLQQELLVEEITSIVRQEAIPLTFDGDLRFLNFTAFGRQSPTFLSLVRDPLDPKVFAKYRRKDLTIPYSGSISHFCGQDTRCTRRNSRWALERAKDNVSRWYPVVGLLDHMDVTLKALENTFPYFFGGASEVYKRIQPTKIGANDRHASMKVTAKKRLREILAKEVEFYQWLKSRLFNKTGFGVG
ncbi:heparan sulfate 2-O-sulfotransferase 1 [Orussus abietinus]|uniref:heparan sulfate 2-O-sulfotransferase 1 n=1 Tax=Orussus abietinus TaxID=222816 RepID=UPI000626CC32|nr:heparan sulfate 2-O-sulfotransferase 1 [Orussus abietinus]